jgi:hypothetical protein
VFEETRQLNSVFHLKDRARLKVFENRMLGRIAGIIEEVTVC